MVYIAITIFKVVMCLAGVVYSSVCLTQGAIKKDKNKTRKGIILIALTSVLLLVITILEFQLHL